MAEAAVTFLLQQVTEVLVGYKDLIEGAEADFYNLNEDLTKLKTFLNVAEQRRITDQMLKKLVMRIRKVVYEVEDTIDTCLTDAIKKEVKAKNSRVRSLLSSAPSLSLAKDVRSVREEKVRPLFSDGTYIKYSGEGSGLGQITSIDSRRDTPIRQNRVVGFEDEEIKIIDYLYEKRNELDVISIIGIPGQGKTTLAWKVYHNDHVGFEFSIRIWIYISQTFNSRDVFLQILRKFSRSQNTSSLNDDELAQTVRSCLEKERFLLVLDDVWSVDAWNKIKEVLPENNAMGKVLITSREATVGARCRVHHDLRFLTKDESWTLLQYEVFNSLEKCPFALKDIGYKIAEKCDGVPLTIIVIGGILGDQYTKSPWSAEDEWKTVAENVSEALQGDKADRVTDVVSLSYNRLSDDMKECFLFLGVFPEDYEIPTKMLCGLWISEGFILPKNPRQSLEQCAEDNLNDLICRNLLKAEKRNEMGKVKTCRVHDMIRAFSISKSKEQNLFKDIKSSDMRETKSLVDAVKDSHRLCFRSDLSTFLSKKASGPHVRSFMCFYDQPVKLEPAYTSVIPDMFPKLRILESKCIKFDKFPLKVTKLIHLRYLTLYVEILKDLPDAIAQLWNLQSLVVETQSSTITIKANMWKMIRLRYLKTKAAFVLDNSKWTGDAGENLHYLSRLAPESCTPAVSQKAKNLRTLGISGKLTNIFDTNFLKDLEYLEKLELVNSSIYEPKKGDFLRGLPNGDCFPPSLKRLTLKNTRLGWQDMSSLASIRSLQVLKLKDNAFVGGLWDIEHYNFPSLQLLIIENMELENWTASEGAFRILRFLVVKNCENLKEIPESLGAHLEKLEIERVSSSVVLSAEKIKHNQKERGVQLNLIAGPACGTK